MSMLASRPQAPERASAVLPSITCSSCAAQIPLSSLGEHVCRPAPPLPSSSSYSQSNAGSSSSRAAPRPSQIAIPAANPTMRSLPSPSDPPRPAFAGPSSARSSPSSARPSPSSLAPAGLHIPSSHTPSPRTPSPTNPFFPHPIGAQPQATLVHGLGLGIGGRPEGPYPTDAPLPQNLQIPDTTSGGGAGMAGVGRRAFAAAAWGVTAGVAMAQAAQSHRPPFEHQPHSMPPQSSPLPPQPHPQPQQQPQQQRPELRHQPHSLPVAQQPRSQAPWQQQQQSRASPTPREAPLLPKVPLSGRQRSGTQSNGSAPQPPQAPSIPPASPPQRSASAMSQARPAPSSPPRVQRSASAMSYRGQETSPQAPGRKASVASSTSSSHSGPGESIAQLLKARAADQQQQQNGGAKLPFFEKYKQLVDSTSTSSTPVLGIGASRRSSEADTAERLVDSPQQTTFDLDDDEEEDDFDEAKGSALPWATPQLAESPEIRQAPTFKTRPDPQRKRYPTSGSEASSSSQGSSRSGGGRFGMSSQENEEVVTPSQSWEGLAERAGGMNIPRSASGLDMVGGGGKAGGIENAGAGGGVGLEQIGEEEEDDDDEGERVVFGAITPQANKRRGSERIKNSESNSTITAKNAHARSRTAPLELAPPHHHHPATHSHSHDGHHSRSTSASSSSATRRKKSCAKCGSAVGGSARFVERDGVVLCERDWKAMYLPSCRRCSLPIEKSAVSSSDGQLKGKWHRECFTCERCEQPFEGDSFYVLGGRPWCQLHYHEENGTLCASSSCRQPIEGPCILTAGPKPQRFHPGHLRCDHRGGVSGAQNCRENMDEYYEVGEGRYCERHVADAMRRAGGGVGGPGGGGGGGGGGGMNARAEKRRTRLVDLPVGGF